MCESQNTMYYLNFRTNVIDDETFTLNSCFRTPTVPSQEKNVVTEKFDDTTVSDKFRT